MGAQGRGHRTPPSQSLGADQCILSTAAQSSKGNATTLTCRQTLARQDVTLNANAREDAFTSSMLVPPAYGLSAEPSGGRGFLDKRVRDSLTSRRISESQTQGSGSAVRAFPGRNGHGASRRGPSTAGVCGPPVYAGVAGQEDRLAVGIRVRADGWVTTLKQESLRSCEAIGGK